AVGKAIRCDVDDAHDQRPALESQNPVADVPFMPHGALSCAEGSLCDALRTWRLCAHLLRAKTPSTQSIAKKEGPPRLYHGVSIIDTICTARRSTFFFCAVVIDSPSSGMKLAIDMTWMPVAGGMTPGGKL